LPQLENNAPTLGGYAREWMIFPSVLNLRQFYPEVSDEVNSWAMVIANDP
jgi:hypothetical protein